VSLDDDTLPSVPAPGPDPVFEWLREVIRTAVWRLGVSPESTGVITEERRHHASWKWSGTGRSVTLVETIPRGRQILSVRSSRATAWYEGHALRWFPGLEEMILRNLSAPGVPLGKPDGPLYPPLP